jgi:hypothetical protein
MTNRNKFVLSDFLTFERAAIGFYKISYTDTVVLNNLLTFCRMSSLFTDNGSGLICAGI